jgi:OmpA-OmpF porin, OOP family
MSKKLGAAFLACGAVWTGQALAVNTENYDIPYVGAMGSYVIPDSVRSNNGGYGFDALIGMPLGDWFPIGGSAAELNFFDNNLERDIDGDNNYQTGIMLDWVKDFGLYGWPKDGAMSWAPDFKPFTILGLGAIQDDVLGDKHGVFAFEGGAGVIATLPWFGWAVRTDVRFVGQVNNKSVPDHDVLVDYRFNLGLQIPLTPFFDRNLSAPAARECDVAVVNPVTGRSDCATDSDHDGVPDSLDKCPGSAPGSAVDANGCATSAGDADHDGVADASDVCPNTPAQMKVDAVGCAVSQTVVLTDVRFKLDSAELTDDAKSTLDNVAKALSSQKNLNVEIGGYADNMGSDEYNKQLSQKRAEEVRNYLIGQGVDGGRLSAVGYGERKPVVANDTEAGREMNRRVEFKVSISNS